MTNTMLHDKFRGCFLGALVGDCLGLPFELKPAADKTVIADFLSERLASVASKKVLPYTDDTEMTRSVAESLIVNNGFVAEDMAYRFTEEYFQTPGRRRRYGKFVHTVFKKLRNKEYVSVFDPAAEQFKGEGSFGNGAAMRVHPVALFCHGKSQETLMDICRQMSRLTHTHQDGYNGAILLALAIRWALDADPNTKFNPMDLLERLQTVMEELEAERPHIPDYPSFCTQIKKIKRSLEDRTSNPTDLGQDLGSQLTAVLSIPAAIFCFLRAQEPLPDYKANNPFLRTLFLAISLGFDTDTVATMACALSGAFYGVNAVPEVLVQQCEAWEEISEKADRMAALIIVKQ